MISRPSLGIRNARLPLGPAPRFARCRAQGRKGGMAKPWYLRAREHCEFFRAKCVLR